MYQNLYTFMKRWLVVGLLESANTYRLLRIDTDRIGLKAIDTKTVGKYLTRSFGFAKLLSLGENVIRLRVAGTTVVNHHRA